MRDPAADFESWAQLAARLRLLDEGQQRALLAEHQLADSWASIHESWSRELNEDIAAGRMERPQRYAQLCREARHGRADGPPGALAPPLPPGAPAPPPPPGAAQRQPPPPPARGSRGSGSASDFRQDLTPDHRPELPNLSQDETITTALPADEVLALALARAKRKPVVGDDFRARLSGNARPSTPSDDQHRTEPVGIEDMAAVAHEAHKSASWTVEEYAELCLRLDARPQDAGELWRARGIEHPNARQLVHILWRDKLREDPAPTGRYERYRASGGSTPG